MQTFKHAQSFVFNTDEVGSPRESRRAFRGLIGALRVRGGDELVSEFMRHLLCVTWRTGGEESGHYFHWTDGVPENITNAVSSFFKRYPVEHMKWSSPE